MELNEKDKKFIFDNIPIPYNTLDRYSRYILSKIQMHDVLCTITKKTIIELIDPLIKQYKHRFFCRVDDTHQQKRPASIIDKIRRSQNNSECERYEIHNFENKMTDLAHFRIVCNFLSDVDKVSEVIKNSEEIKRSFHIKQKSTIILRPKDRKSGERSIKFVLEYRKKSGLFIEIQVMTQLQEAWDKKDHFLVYEKRRSFSNKDEEIFPDFLDAKMFATAELLFVADEYFEQLRNAREDKNETT